MFKENARVEQVYPVAERQQNKIRFTIIPQGPVVANQDIIPIHKPKVGLTKRPEKDLRINSYHYTGAKSGNVEEATDQKTEPHVTFSDQLLNRDADLHLNSANTETLDTMSSTVETFVPDAKVMARIQEKHELQDINDRFSQYIQVLQSSTASDYIFVLISILHSLQHRISSQKFCNKKSSFLHLNIW